MRPLLVNDIALHQTQRFNRRQFLRLSQVGLGAAALSGLGASSTLASAAPANSPAPAAKRVIYLFQSGAPSQFELFDPKPALEKLHESELPDSIRQGQRLTGMTSGQKSFPVVRSIYPFV